jgi:tetratricopeptide (TPR) repeat protein
MATCEWWLGRFDQAIESSNRAIELLEGTESTGDTIAFAYFLLPWLHQHKGNHEEALIFKEKAMRVLEQQFNLRYFVWSLCAATFAYICLGRWDEAVAEGQKASKAAEEYSSNSLLSFAAFSISWAFSAKGEHGRAVEYCNMAMEKAATPGDKAWALTWGTWALCRAGQAERALEIWKSILPIYQASQWLFGLTNTLILIGEAYWLTGKYHDARQNLTEGLMIAEEYGMKFLGGWAQRLLGEVALKNDPAQARLHFEKSIAVLQEIKAENELALAYAGYGRLHKQQGKIAKAREYLIQALGIFERLGTLIEPDKVRQELADLPQTSTLNCEVARD